MPPKLSDTTSPRGPRAIGPAPRRWWQRIFTSPARSTTSSTARRSSRVVGPTATIRSLDLKRVESDGATVFVTYELTHKEGHRLRNSEVLTVRDNQVNEVEVYFGWTLPHRAPLGGYLEGSRYERGDRNPVPAGAGCGTRSQPH